MILYHGSNIEINHIDLSRCKPYKDFGQGFYATDIFEQAQQLAQKNAQRYGNEPVVNVYEFDENQLENPELKVKVFHQPNQEWAEFVMQNRTTSIAQPSHDFDIVVGPVANDDISVLFRTYRLEIIDLPTLARALTYRKLTNQYLFHTPKSLSYLDKRASV